MRSLIDTGGSYQIQSSQHENRPLSPFPSNILHFPLIALPGLILCHNLKAKAINYIGHPLIEGALSRGVF
jgi:hypothetical protein